MARSFWQKTGLVLFSGSLLCTGAVMHAACENVKGAKASQKPEDLQETLAKIDDVVITVGEFQDRINKQSPLGARALHLDRAQEGVPRQPGPLRGPRQRGREEGAEQGRRGR